jgi:hypothetical protein
VRGEEGVAVLQAEQLLEHFGLIGLAQLGHQSEEALRQHMQSSELNVKVSEQGFTSRERCAGSSPKACCGVLPWPMNTAATRVPVISWA